ncbi:microfibrillar-associated protein 1, partial [Phenoliferia sp. Uapishka_3]
MSSKPKLTNPLRPVARYRKGKPIAPVQSDSDSDSEEAPAADNEDEQSDEDTNPSISTTTTKKARPTAASFNVALKGVEVDDKGMVTVGGRGEVGKTARELESEEESEEDESSEEEDKPKPVYKMPTMPGADSDEGSSEYETDSDEEPPKPIYKPVFVSKRNRDTIAEREAALDPDILEERRLAELEQQKKQSHDLVAESILRELAEKEVQEVFPDVDDEDGVEPEAEFEAWKLRELMRIKRDREAQYAREKEREEVEARRALPEALRMKEDMERAKKSRDEKTKGGQVFLQKYHHKGAFYTDTEVLKKHDYTAPTVSTNRNVESLPAVMQKRNFGKYTHLAAEDTTNADAGWAKKSAFGGPGGGKDAAGGGCFTCGGPHVHAYLHFSNSLADLFPIQLKRDCPQSNAAGPSGSNDAGASGSSRDSGWGSRPPPPRGGNPEDRFASGQGRGDDRRPPPSNPNDRDRLDYDDMRDKRGDWNRGGDRQRERYAEAERGS